MSGGSTCRSQSSGNDGGMQGPRWPSPWRCSARWRGHRPRRRRRRIDAPSRFARVQRSRLAMSRSSRSANCTRIVRLGDAAGLRLPAQRGADSVASARRIRSRRGRQRPPHGGDALALGRLVHRTDERSRLRVPRLRAPGRLRDRRAEARLPAGSDASPGDPQRHTRALRLWDRDRSWPVTPLASTSPTVQRARTWPGRPCMPSRATRFRRPRR